MYPRFSPVYFVDGTREEEEEMILGRSLDIFYYYLLTTIAWRTILSFSAEMTFECLFYFLFLRLFSKSLEFSLREKRLIVYFNASPEFIVILTAKM